MRKFKHSSELKFHDSFENSKRIIIEDDMINLLFKIVIFGFIPLLFIGSIFYFNNGEVIYGIIELSFCILLIIVFNLKRISNKYRVISVISLVYIISFFVLLTTGNSGAGFLSVFGTLIFASIFMKKTTIYKFFVLNVFIFLITSILLYTNNLDRLVIAQYKTSWIILSLVVNITAICIIFLENYLISLINSNADDSLNRMHYLNGILNCSDEGIITVNLFNRITLINNKAKEMLEIDTDVIGYDYYDIVKQVNKDNKRRDFMNQGYSLNNFDAQILFYSNSTKRNYIFHKHIGEIRDNKNTLYAYSIMLRDITEQIAKETEIIHISLHDHLTGLYNRRFYESKRQVLDQPEFYPLSFIMCDVNGLKIINDSFGHEAGDNMLIEVSKVLKETFRETDIISRIGGDEFMILLPNTSQADGISLIKRLKEVSKNRNFEPVPISLSIAIGLGTKTTSEEVTSQIEKHVEDEMYSNKILEGSSAKSKIVDVIMSTLYEKNNREMQHSKRVSKLCEDIAIAMNMDNRFINQVRLAGLMHDIGKIGIKEQILNKNTSLSDDEFNEIKKHPEIGSRILGSVKEFMGISPFVQQHHEKLDGTGYPEGISGADILPQTRIITIADAYDAMTGYRTYKNPLSRSDAVKELIKGKGSQFDEKIVDIFINKVLQKKKEYQT